MALNLSVNNETITVDAENNETLLSVLRSQSITSVKCGCIKGMCGACTVLINNKPTPSCLIPVGALKNEHIHTLEYFALTDEYDDILKGLELAKVKLCGFCNTGKIFAIHDIIDSDNTPNRSAIIRRMRTFTCQCTGIESLIDAIFKAFDIRLERKGHIEYGRK